MEDIWVALGDSIRLDVRETLCHHDHCAGLGWPAGDSGWSVKNSRIVSLSRTCSPVCVMAHGRRIGQTIVTVRGLHGRSDTIPSWSPPPRTVERRIRVGRPVRQIRILPRPDTVLVGRPQAFSARAFDRAGRVIPKVPIEILVETDSVYKRGMLATQPSPVEFEQPGRRAVIATFRGLSDTLMVTVIAGTE